LPDLNKSLFDCLIYWHKSVRLADSVIIFTPTPVYQE